MKSSRTMCPRRAARETFVPVTEGKVKSGAGWPISWDTLSCMAYGALTTSVPFIPASLCPATVQKNSYVPGFVGVNSKVAI